MLPLDKYPSFAEDLFTFKFVKVFEANQKILHKISTLLLRNEKYRVNKFAKSNEPPTNFSILYRFLTSSRHLNGEQERQKHAFLNERAWLGVTGGHRLCTVNRARVSSCHDRLSSFIHSTLNEYREQSKLVEVGIS